MAITRRDFLTASLGASTLVTLGGRPCCAGNPLDLLARTATAADHAAGDTILIVVQLAGGNDGLNTVVPYGDDAYGRNRTTLRLPAAGLHKIDGLLGFHPQMQAFDRLYKEGCLTIVQGVGYANHSQQHEAAMRAWQTAQPERTTEQSGWLGRAVDGAVRPAGAGKGVSHPLPERTCGCFAQTVADTFSGPFSGPATVPAVFVGDLKQPFSLNAERAVVPSLRSLDDWVLQQPAPGRAGYPAAPAAGGQDGRLLDCVRRASEAASRTSRRIESLLGGKSPSPPAPLPGHHVPMVAGDGRSSASAAAEYPPFQLAGRLRTIAQLIRADLGIRIFCTELGGQEPGGFDNHAGQRDNHASLLRQLSESVAALLDDLRRQKLLDRVVLMTFSEFGRTVAENGRRGTDHGAAAPMFLAGGKVRGGLVGPHPSLTDLDNGGLRSHTDFRRVYATLLDGWLGFPSQPVLGRQYEPLPILT